MDDDDDDDDVSILCNRMFLPAKVRVRFFIPLPHKVKVVTS